MVTDFWNEEAGRWSLKNKNPLVGWYDSHNSDKNEERLLFGSIPNIPGNLIALEYGCGPGRNMIKYQHHFSRIDGADISAVILEKLRDNLQESNVQMGDRKIYLTNGRTLSMIPDSIYDVVFSIICMQHIGCRSWRLSLYDEIYRVLKPGGHFTFQMGFGPGHPISVDYFHEYDYTDASHKDTRVESVQDLQKDLESYGFINFNHTITPPCHDQHPEWIWVNVKKP